MEREQAIRIAREVRKPMREARLGADEWLRVDEAHMVLASEYLRVLDSGRIAPV